MSTSQRPRVSMFTVAILFFMAGIGAVLVVQMFSATTPPPEATLILNKEPIDVAPLPIKEPDVVARPVSLATSDPVSTSKPWPKAAAGGTVADNDVAVSPPSPEPATAAQIQAVQHQRQQMKNYIEYNNQWNRTAYSTGGDYGIFVRVLEASGNFDETTAALERALIESSLTLHAKRDLTYTDKQQQARVYVLTSPAYMDAAKGEAPETISAQILRIGVYEYGEGKKVHINMGNPTAHAMVFYAGSKKYADLLAGAKFTAGEIKDIAAKVPGTPVSVQLEPVRSEKTLNKFNGDGPAKMMAKFRNWKESQNEVLKDKPENFDAVVARVENTLRASQDKGVEDSSGWRLLSKIPVGDNAVYFGITNDYTENKWIRINSDFRSDGKAKDAPYPGVDHAPSMPLEVLVINDGKNVKVVQYGQMWRTQLYFWDAGYMAFAKNTLIPSIIFSSIDQVLTATASADTAFAK